jgi:hypothetical protein
MIHSRTRSSGGCTMRGSWWRPASACDFGWCHINVYGTLAQRRSYTTD